MNEAKVRCLKVTRPECGNQYCVYRLDEPQHLVDGEFDGAEIGDQITLELCEMTETELAALPEFAGW